MNAPNQYMNQRGAALVVGIVLLVVATLLALVAMNNTAFQERMASNQHNKTISLMAAEFGAWRFLDEITDRGYDDDEESDASQWGLHTPQAAGDAEGVFWVEILNHADEVNGEPLRVAVFGESRTGEDVLGRSELHLTVDVLTTTPGPTGPSNSAAINLVGPLGEFGTPNSNEFKVYGAAQGDGLPPGPAVGVSRPADETTMECALGPKTDTCPMGADRLDNYHGGIITMDYSRPLANPDPDAEPTNFWTDPATLQAWVEDVCSVAGSRCGTTVAEHTTGRGKNKDQGAVPKITVVRGDATVDMGGGTVGAGLLIVEGNLTMNGNPDWDGVIISLGGQIDIKGGGNTEFNGTIYSLNLDTTKTPWEENTGCARKTNGECWQDDDGNDISGLIWRTAGGGNADYRHNCDMVKMAAELLGLPLYDESTDPRTPLNARAMFDDNHGCGPAGEDSGGEGTGEAETRVSIVSWIEVLN